MYACSVINTKINPVAFATGFIFNYATVPSVAGSTGVSAPSTGASGAPSTGAASSFLISSDIKSI